MISHRLASTAAVSFVILAVLLVPALAVADPIDDRRAEAERIRQEVAVFDAELEVVVEEYNQATEDLKQVKSQIRKNTKALKAARRDLAAAREQLDERVAAMYKQRSVNIVDVFFSADSFDELAGQIELMRRIGEQDAALVDEVESHKREIREKRTSLMKDRRKATRLVTDVGEKKSDIEGRLADRQAMLSGVESEIRELERAEEEAARRAAEAAMADAPAETSGESVASAQSAGASSGGSSSAATGSSSGSTSSSGSSSSGGSSSSQPSESSGGGRSSIVSIAARYLGTPYKYGGTSPQTGFDCSGFVQYVYAQAGISLPRTSQTQQQIGTRVSMNALLPGDLVFRGYPAYHVGIYAGGGQAIHSPRTGYTVCYQSISYWTSAVRP